MREIRPIQIHEAEPFLELLCRVFNLDLGRARAVFLSEPLFDLSRKWALIEEGTICSILTTTSLTFGWGRAIGIAGVATEPHLQRQGLARALLGHVLDRAAQEGEGPAMLFAHRPGIYEALGFELADEVVRAPLATHSNDAVSEMPFTDVRSLYGQWASQDPARLVRTDDRWKYWSWNYRACEPFGGGYVCFEPGVCREAVVPVRQKTWPVPKSTDWLGLRKTTAAIGVPVKGRSKVELLAMTRGFPSCPQMFMTDQF